MLGGAELSVESYCGCLETQSTVSVLVSRHKVTEAIVKLLAFIKTYMKAPQVFYYYHRVMWKRNYELIAQL